MLSLYPGDPSMTLGLMGHSPCRTPTPQRVTMLSPVSHYGSRCGTLDNGKNKILTVHGTVEFDRDRQDMNI